MEAEHGGSADTVSSRVSVRTLCADACSHGMGRTAPLGRIVHRQYRLRDAAELAGALVEPGAGLVAEAPSRGSKARRCGRYSASDRLVCTLPITVSLAVWLLKP